MDRFDSYRGCHIMQNSTYRPNKFTQCYGVFCDDATKAILGYVENSFSMGWSRQAVRSWDRRNAQLTVQKLRKDYRGDGFKFFVVNLNSPKSLYLVDYSQYYSPTSRSWDRRNLPFTKRKVAVIEQKDK